MPHAIQIPRLGWSMEQGTFVGWLKQCGDSVKPGDPLFTLEGEKAIQEIEAVDAGTLHFETTHPLEGDVVAVGAAIGFLLAAGEVAPPVPRRTVPPQNAPSASKAEQSQTLPDPVRAKSRSQSNVATQLIEPTGFPTATPAAAPAVRRLARQLGVDLAQFNVTGRISEADVCRRYLQQRGEFTLSPAISNPLPVQTLPRKSDVRVRSTADSIRRRSRGLPAISPRAARLANQQGIDWTRLTGTGSSGRIRELDVLAACRNFQANTLPAEPITSVSSSVASHSVPVTAMRRAIANRMTISHQATVPVTLTADVEVSAIVEFREQLKRADASLIPSVTDCFVKITALALQEHPLLNARWSDEGIEVFDERNLGIAVDTDAGLLVPVLRRADEHSLLAIAKRSHSLIERARSRSLTSSDFQGSTFTISNLGALGIDAFTPVINFPEVAILGLGRIDDRRHLTLSLTFDHRVIDGAPAARFLQTIASVIAARTWQA